MIMVIHLRSVKELVQLNLSASSENIFSAQSIGSLCNYKSGL